MLEHRYIVLKKSDVARLDPKAQAQLERLVLAHDFVRELRGAKPLQGVFVEDDWPEYQMAVRSIIRRSESVSTRRLLTEIVLGVVVTALVWYYIFIPSIVT